MRTASLVSPSCRVDRAIGGNQPLLARAALDRIAVLHPDHAREILRAQPADDVAIVDLAASRLLAAGIVAELDVRDLVPAAVQRSEEHTSELQSLMRISYAVFCLSKKTTTAEPNLEITPYLSTS